MPRPTRHRRVFGARRDAPGSWALWESAGSPQNLAAVGPELPRRATRALKATGSIDAGGGPAGRRRQGLGRGQWWARAPRATTRPDLTSDRSPRLFFSLSRRWECLPRRSRALCDWTQVQSTRFPPVPPVSVFLVGDDARVTTWLAIRPTVAGCRQGSSRSKRLALSPGELVRSGEGTSSPADDSSVDDDGLVGRGGRPGWTGLN
jgi:hypothetical protein